MTNEAFLERIKLISDSTRLQILQLLSDKGTLCACKILEALNIVQSTLSHHMNLLVDAGIVSCRKEGKWCYYTLIHETICDLSYFLQDICRDKQNNENKCCCK